LDIVQNMFLGHELLKHRLLDENQMEITARQTLADLSVTTVQSIRQPVGSLSGGQRQAVAVARAVMREAKLVVMDEPTAALGVSQTAQVLDLIKRLASRGIAVLVISHNLTDVFAVADRLAVLNLGHLVSTGPISDYDTQSAVELITTGRLTRTESSPPAAGNDTADGGG
jgi:ABC-type sugar transport system ATPase subunit